MPSSPVPGEWFDGLDREEPGPRSDMTPPGPPIYFRLRTLSHCRETVLLANQLNACPAISDQMRYDFLLHSRRRTTGWVRRPRENEADLALVMDLYNYSRTKARQALRTMGPDQVEAMRDWMRPGGR